MQEQKQSRLEAWRGKYAALIVALVCLYSVISNWGEGWFFTILMSFGVLICGIFAFFDLINNFRMRRRN